MIDYFRRFKSLSAYTEYVNSSGYTLPNVSVIDELSGGIPKYKPKPNEMRSISVFETINTLYPNTYKVFGNNLNGTQMFLVEMSQTTARTSQTRTILICNESNILNTFNITLPGADICGAPCLIDNYFVYYYRTSSNTTFYVYTDYLSQTPTLIQTATTTSRYSGKMGHGCYYDSNGDLIYVVKSMPSNTEMFISYNITKNVYTATDSGYRTYGGLLSSLPENKIHSDTQYYVFGYNGTATPAHVRDYKIYSSSVKSGFNDVTQSNCTLVNNSSIPISSPYVAFHTKVSFDGKLKHFIVDNDFTALTNKPYQLITSSDYTTFSVKEINVLFQSVKTNPGCFDEITFFENDSKVWYLDSSYNIISATIDND